MDLVTKYLIVAVCHCVISVAFGRLGFPGWPAFAASSVLLVGVAAVVQFGGF